MRLEEIPKNNTTGATDECVNSVQAVDGGYLRVTNGILTVGITNKDVWENLTDDLKKSPKEQMFMIKFQNDVGNAENNLTDDVSKTGSKTPSFLSDDAENKDEEGYWNLSNKTYFNVQVNRVDIEEHELADEINGVLDYEVPIEHGKETGPPEISTGDIANNEESQAYEHMPLRNQSETFDHSIFEGIARHSIDVRTNVLSNDIGKWMRCLIMIFCFLMQCCTGLLYSMGIIYVILLKEFGASRSITSLVQSICLAVTYGLGFFVGMIIEKIGLRYSILCGSVFAAIGFAASAFMQEIYYIIIFIGIIGGIGVSLLTISSFAAIPIYFKDKQNAAVAFTSMGTGVGSVVWPIVMPLFIEEYSWRGNYLLVAGILFNVCVMAMFFKPQKLLPEQKALAKVNRSMKTMKIHFKEMIRNPRFVAYLVWSSFDSFSISIFSQMLVDFGLQLGYSGSDSNDLLIFYLLSNAVGRFLVGVLNRFKIPHFALFGIFCYMCGAAFIALSYTSTYKLSFGFSMASGFTMGLHVAMSMVILLRIVGPEKYGLGWGLSASCLGIGFSCSGPFAGFIADLYSYNMSFFISGILVIVISSMFVLVVLCTRKTNRTPV